MGNEDGNNTMHWGILADMFNFDKNNERRIEEKEEQIKEKPEEKMPVINITININVVSDQNGGIPIFRLA